MQTTRPALCCVPTSEVLALTAELAALGGGDVAVGRCWAAAVGHPAAPAAFPLDACCSNPGNLEAALEQELWPWLRSGYNATVLLLQGCSFSAGSDGGDAQGSDSAAQLGGWGVLARIGAVALSEGWQLGLSWQFISGNEVSDPLGQRQHMPAAASSKQQPVRPSSRLGKQAGEAEGSLQQRLIVGAASGDELAQLVNAMRQQAQQLTAAADGLQPPAIVLRAELQGPGPASRQLCATLHVLHVLAGSSGSSSPSGGQNGGTGVVQCSRHAVKQQQQPVAGAGQWEAFLKLAGEVADLHQRRREGDHLLAAAKLTPLNQTAAPLLAGGARLFVAASPPAGGGSSSSSSSFEGAGTQRQLLPLLAALRHVQAVCTKGAAAADGSLAAADWLPCGLFLEQLEEQQQAERRRRAEAAALAAAEASRREKLRAAARERQQQQQEGPTLSASHAQRTAPARQGKERAPQHVEAPAERPAERPAEPAAASPPPAAPYQAGPYSSPAKAAPPTQQPTAGSDGAAAAAAATDSAQQTGMAGEMPRAQHQTCAQVVMERGSPGLSPSRGSSTSSSLQHLREQFQSLYAAVASPRHAAAPAAAPAAVAGAMGSIDCAAGQESAQSTTQQAHASSGSGSHRLAQAEPQAQQPRSQVHRTIAAGVAAADNVATHVAALRMQAAAEAQRALQAQRELLGPSAGGGASPAAGAKEQPLSALSDADDPGFTWIGRSGSSDSGSRPGSGRLAQRLEDELLQLQHEAAERAAAAVGGGGGATPVSSSADMASLADLDTEAPSIAAMYRRPVSRAGASTARRAEWQRGSSCSEQHLEQQQQRRAAGAASSRHGAAAAAADSGWLHGWPSSTAELSQRPGASDVSDIFQSDCMPQFTPPSAAGAAGRAGQAGAGSLPGTAFDSSLLAGWPADGAACSSSQPHGQFEEQPAQQKQQQQHGLLSDGCSSSSYAASWRRQRPSRGTESEPWETAAAEASARAGQQASPCSAARESRGPLSVSWEDEACQQASTGALLPCASQGADGAQGEPADAAGLLEELQQEQRVNAALLQQLHELQQALEEALAAAAAAAQQQQQPLSAGVEDPADFNAVLAALQRERQQHSCLRGQLALQQQQAEERELALEAQLHTLRRQLLVATARCRAWEQQSPLAALFRRYEEDLQRQQAEAQRLEGENCQLAALLAEADLEQLTGASAQLGDESAAAAVCQDHRRKLAQAQAQIRRLQEQLTALQKELQAAQRRDRLAELCRKQAESGQRAAAELRQQLAAREQQLQAQSLAAAEAAAETARLRGQLRQAEAELGRALTDRADLADAVSSLRQQNALLRGQGSRDRILKSMQCPAPC